MSRAEDERIRQVIQHTLDAEHLSSGRRDELLAEIHQQIRKESGIMRNSKKKMVLATAAAMVVLGTITAVAAGKITGLRSGTNRNDAVYTAEKLEKMAENAMGDGIAIPEELADGSRYQEGYLTEVEAYDDAGYQVGTYPEVIASYGEKSGISLSISKPMAELQGQQSEHKPEVEENYADTVLYGEEDHYLFLPPDAKPAEEDVKLQEEGKLWISYGSSEEERKVFRNVSWTEGEQSYLLYTFEDISMEEMMELAKGYLDSRK